MFYIKVQDIHTRMQRMLQDGFSQVGPLYITSSLYQKTAWF